MAWPSMINNCPGCIIYGHLFNPRKINCHLYATYGWKGLAKMISYLYKIEREALNFIKSLFLFFNNDKTVGSATMDLWLGFMTFGTWRLFHFPLPRTNITFVILLPFNSTQFYVHCTLDTVTKQLQKYINSGFFLNCGLSVACSYICYHLKKWEGFKQKVTFYVVEHI